MRHDAIVLQPREQLLIQPDTNKDGAMESLCGVPLEGRPVGLTWFRGQDETLFSEPYEILPNLRRQGRERRSRQAST